MYGLIFLAVAAVVGYIAWKRLQIDKLNTKLSAASANWQSTSGQVQASRIDIHRSRMWNSDTKSHDEIIRYLPKVDYGYAVGGQQYQGARVSFEVLDFAFENRARKVIEKYPVGAALPVYYDPTDPNFCVLDRDAKPRSVSIATIMLFVGTAILVFVGIAGFFVPIQ
jgi:hypothetical protein